MSQRLMILTVGQTVYSEAAVTLIIFIGMLIGFSGLISQTFKKIILLIAFFHSLLLAIFYNSIINIILSNSILGSVNFVLASMSLVGSAVVFTNQTYTPKYNLQNYLQISLYATIASIALIPISFYFSANAIYFFVSLGFIAVLNNTENTNLEKISINKSSFISILTGAISGGFVTYFFSIYKALIFPTGLEFNFYLILIFLYSYCSVNLFAKRNLYLKLPLGQVISFIFVLCTLFIITSVDGSGIFIFDIIQLTKKFSLFSYYPVITFVLMAFIMVPYFFLSISVPYLQKFESKKNHLFFNTLGSILIQTVFLIPTIEFKLNLVLLIIWLLTCLNFLIYNVIGARKKYFFVTVGILVSVQILKMSDLDDKIIAQARRFHTKYWMPEEVLDRPGYRSNAYVPSDISMRIGSRTAGFGSEFENLKTLTLDGYSAENHTPHDYIKAKLAVSIIDTYRPKSVLLLGLGNHVVLKAISSHALDDTTIDVIDNNLFFQNEKFLKAVASASGFDWPQKNVNLLSTDALKYLYNMGKQYDLIVWNLTLPNYAESIPLFSVSFAKQLRQHLTKKGVLIEPFYNNSLYDCVNYDLYQNMNIFHTVKPLSLVLYFAESDNGEKSNAINFNRYCESRKKIDFNSSFVGRQFDKGVIKKNNAELENLILNDYTQMNDTIVFSQSTAFEKNNLNPSLIVNTSESMMDADGRRSFSRKLSQYLNLDISYMDYYDNEFEFKKLSQMLELYSKPDTVLLNIRPPDFIDVHYSHVKSYYGKSTKVIDLEFDDQSFWNSIVNFGKFQQEPSLKILGSNPMKLFIRKRIENLKHKETFGLDADLLVVAVNSAAEFDTIKREINLSRAKDILLWHPPWLQLNLQNTNRCFSEISWRIDGETKLIPFESIANQIRHYLSQQDDKYERRIFFRALTVPPQFNSNLDKKCVLPM